MATAVSISHERSEANKMRCRTRPENASRLIAGVSAAFALVWICLLVLPGHVLPLSILKIVLILNVLHLIGQTIASAVSLRLGSRFGAYAVTAQIAMTLGIFLLFMDTPALRYSFAMTPAMVASACAWTIDGRHSASRRRR